MVLLLGSTFHTPHRQGWYTCSPIIEVERTALLTDLKGVIWTPMSKKMLMVAYILADVLVTSLPTIHQRSDTSGDQSSVVLQRCRHSCGINSNPFDAISHSSRLGLGFFTWDFVSRKHSKQLSPESYDNFCSIIRVLVNHDSVVSDRQTQMPSTSFEILGSNAWAMSQVSSVLLGGRITPFSPPPDLEFSWKVSRATGAWPRSRGRQL